MNPTVILSLISALYEQNIRLQQQVEELKANGTDSSSPDSDS